MSKSRKDLSGREFRSSKKGTYIRVKLGLYTQRERTPTNEVSRFSRPLNLIFNVLLDFTGTNIGFLETCLYKSFHQCHCIVEDVMWNMTNIAENYMPHNQLIGLSEVSLLNGEHKVTCFLCFLFSGHDG